MGHGGRSEGPANGQHCFASNVSEPLWKWIVQSKLSLRWLQARLTS